MNEIRRWKRFCCNPRVKGHLYWAHRFLPRVKIVITDVSEKGIGIVTDWQLEEGICELKITSLPTLRGMIRRQGKRKTKGKTRYHYGLSLTRPLHGVQLINLYQSRRSTV